MPIGTTYRTDDLHLTNDFYAAPSWGLAANTAGDLAMVFAFSGEFDLGSAKFRGPTPGASVGVVRFGASGAMTEHGSLLASGDGSLAASGITVAPDGTVGFVVSVNDMTLSIEPAPIGGEGLARAVAVFDSGDFSGAEGDVLDQWAESDGSRFL